MLTCRPRSCQQRGLSLVELMVGLAIGLLVVAGASMVSSTQVIESRRLLVETQLQQDLRAAADIITRELRRAGSLGFQNLAVDTAWSSPTSSPLVNPYTDITITTAPGGDTVTYKYYRASGAVGPFGFKADGGTIKSNIDASGTWQDLTDRRVMEVTTFRVTRTDGPAASLPCPKECAGGGTACFPTWTVREITVDITGRSVADTSVQRSIRAVARLRNDLLTPSAAGQVCPS